MDERAEGGRGGHAAGDGAENVQQVHLQHVLCHDIAHDHRQKRHENAVDEIDEVESITLTAFTYDEDDFDKENNYRGNSKYTINIKRK